ncbi:MAG: DUF115 domain-containing protein [Anaerolineales bacterium]|jgi:hypothetical protein
MRESIKGITPEPIWRFGRKAWLAWQHARLWPAATFHPRRRESVRRLSAFKDKHRGERCFIIGNGPSLKDTDISKLKSEITFGMNRVYLAFDEWGFETSYYAAINDLVIEQCAGDILKLEMPRFLSWHSQHTIRPAKDIMFLHTTYTGPKFARDVRQRVWEGATVTYVAMQLAFYMGFKQTILIGVDHSFQSEGTPNTTVVSRGDDVDHFDAAYFGKGFRWQLPDLETSEQAYKMARAAYEGEGREILDATIGGKLTVFPKIDYNSLF